MVWDYPTNFSNGTAVNSLGGLIQYAEYVTNNWFAEGFLLIIFLMSLSVGILTNSRKAILAASFITFVFSIYFLRLDSINPIITFLLLVGIIIGAIGSSEGKY